MARIQDVINNLDPDTASQVIEALRNPGATAEGILSAIRDLMFQMPQMQLKVL